MKVLIAILLSISVSLVCSQAALKQFYCPPCNSTCDTIAYSKEGACEHCGMHLIAQNLNEVRESKKIIQQQLNVAIFIHNGVELLDFAGPGEVFASSGFTVFTVSATEEPVISQGFVKIIPEYTISNCPKPDIIVLPGGSTGIPLKNDEVIAWIKRSVPETTITLSVCTGAALLSKAGLLDGMTVTTFHNYIDALQEMTPKAKVVRDTRFVDNGSIITTAGVSAGIDGALHVVSKLKGIEAARKTATYMEYDKWKPEEGLIVEAGNKK